MDAVKKHKNVQKREYVSRRSNRDNNVTEFGRRHIDTEREEETKTIFYTVSLRYEASDKRR
jgi:hypothetical protein